MYRLNIKYFRCGQKPYEDMNKKASGSAKAYNDILKGKMALKKMHGKDVERAPTNATLRKIKSQEKNKGRWSNE